MKKIFLMMLFCVAVLSSNAFAQEARMIKLKGSVFVKAAGAVDFVPAQQGMAIGQDAQVRTSANSSCTLSFDAKHKSLLTVDPNTTIAVEGVAPGRVFLPQGRVFALIKNIKTAGKFEVRTPAAISGARGTGWSMEHLDGRSVAKCFDDIIYFANVDDKGEVLHETEIAEGFAGEVQAEAIEEKSNSPQEEVKTQELEVLEPEIYQLSSEDKQEWGSFIEEAVEVLEENSTEGADGSKGEPRVDGDLEEKAADVIVGADGEQVIVDETAVAAEGEAALPSEEQIDPVVDEDGALVADEQSAEDVGIEGNEDPSVVEKEEISGDIFDEGGADLVFDEEFEPLDQPDELREIQEDAKEDVVQQQREDIDQKKSTDPTLPNTSVTPCVGAAC